MSPTTTIPRHSSAGVGARVELARYTVPAGQRVIWGQRVDGVVRLTDCPARGHGRAYLVERELEQDGNDALNALLADYLAVAENRQAIPMATSALQSVLERFANNPPRVSS
jgi:hypothetical protein